MPVRTAYSTALIISGIFPNFFRQVQSTLIGNGSPENSSLDKHVWFETVGKKNSENVPKIQKRKETCPISYSGSWRFFFMLFCIFMNCLIFLKDFGQLKSLKKMKQFKKTQKSIKKNRQLPEYDIGHVSFLFWIFGTLSEFFYTHSFKSNMFV